MAYADEDSMIHKHFDADLAIVVASCAMSELHPRCTPKVAWQGIFFGAKIKPQQRDHFQIRAFVGP